MGQIQTLLYDELVPFYHLLDPLEDHAEEGEDYGELLLGAVPGARTLLELGSGGGHGAFYLKRRFDAVTLVDLSAAMLARSKKLNPDCEHVLGDMRSIRLETTFDCVLIHDAIGYMTSREDLARVADTTFAHLRPGGAALLVPDCVTESFRDSDEYHAADDDERSLRCISWSHDPDPTDETHLTEFAFLLREKGQVRAVHDRHLFGLFPVDIWRSIWTGAGFEVQIVERLLPEEYVDSAYTDKMFLCKKNM